MVKLFAEAGILFQQAADFLASVFDGTVVATSESGTDFLQRGTCQLLGEVHPDLAGVGDGAGAAFACQDMGIEVEKARDFLLDLRDGDGLDVAGLFPSGQRMDEGHVDFGVEQHGVAEEGVEQAFEFADIAVDVFGEVVKDILGEGEAHFLGFSQDDGAAGGGAGRFDADEQSPGEPTCEGIGEGVEFARGAVGGEDHLFLPGMEEVEEVEEFALRVGVRFEAVDIVDHDEIRLEEPVPERIDPSSINSARVLCRKEFRGKETDDFAGLCPGDFLDDGVEEVCFSLSDAAVEEEGVVFASIFERDRLGGGGGEAVCRSDGEGLEGHAWIGLEGGEGFVFGGVDFEAAGVESHIPEGTEEVTLQIGREEGGVRGLGEADADGIEFARFEGHAGEPREEAFMTGVLADPILDASGGYVWRACWFHDDFPRFPGHVESPPSSCLIWSCHGSGVSGSPIGFISG